MKQEYDETGTGLKRNGTNQEQEETKNRIEQKQEGEE